MTALASTSGAQMSSSGRKRLAKMVCAKEICGLFKMYGECNSLEIINLNEGVK